jgi:hypothetical protein
VPYIVIYGSEVKQHSRIRPKGAIHWNQLTLFLPQLFYLANLDQRHRNHPGFLLERDQAPNYDRHKMGDLTTNATQRFSGGITVVPREATGFGDQFFK